MHQSIFAIKIAIIVTESYLKKKEIKSKSNLTKGSSVWYQKGRKLNVLRESGRL